MRRPPPTTRSLRVGLVSMVLLTVACGASGPGPAPGKEVSGPSATESVRSIGRLDEFATLFDSDRGVARLVLLLSPT